MGVTKLCNDTSQYDVRQITGTRVIFLFLCLIFQLIVTVYIFIKTIAISKRSNSHRKHSNHGINTRLKLCLWIYHASVLCQFILSFIVYSDAIFNGNDLSNNYSCYANITLWICPLFYFFSFTLFWHWRLEVVFETSVYKVSKMYTVFMNFGIYLGFIIATTLLAIEFTRILEEASKSMNNIFCIQKVKIVDFFPYLTFDRDWSPPTNFFDCALHDALNSNNRSIFLDIVIYIVAFGVPTSNIIISIQYVRKMYALISGVRDDMDAYDASSQYTHTAEKKNGYDNSKNNNNNNNRNTKRTHVAVAASSPRATTPNVGTPRESSPPVHGQELENINIGNYNNNKNYKGGDIHGGTITNGTIASPRSSRRLHRRHKIEQRKQVYRNGIIAVVSVVSTLLCLLFWSADTGNFAILLYFDSVLNGILMMSVFQFGSWVFDLLCIKMCRCCCCCCACGGIHLADKIEKLKLRIPSSRNLQLSVQDKSPVGPSQDLDLQLQFPPDQPNLKMTIKTTSFVE